MTDLWTLAELVTRAAVALGGTAEQASARVREIPDARTIRWYQTTGLIDRPLALRGRTALYGRRQLLQLVAIKRLQAQGHSLAEIQAELAGLSTEALEPIADLPPQPSLTPRVDVVRDDKTMIRTRFWTEHNHSTGIPADTSPADYDLTPTGEGASAGAGAGESAASGGGTGESAASGVGTGEGASASETSSNRNLPAGPAAAAPDDAASAGPSAPGTTPLSGEPATTSRPEPAIAGQDAPARPPASEQAGSGGQDARRRSRSARSARPSPAPSQGEAADASGKPAAAIGPPVERAAFAGPARASDPDAAGEAGSAQTGAADALPVQGLRLADDVLLILDRPASVIDPTDIEALRDAAAPLLDALVRRGLVADHTRTKEPA